MPYNAYTDRLYQIYDSLVQIIGMLRGCSTVPTDIHITAQRPDIVIVNKSSNSMSIIELSVPFECNIENTHLRKVSRYSSLISDIEEKGYKVKYYPLEVRARNVKKLNDCCLTCY